MTPSQSQHPVDPSRVQELERFASGLLPIWERRDQIEVAQAAVFKSTEIADPTVNESADDDEPMPWKRLPSQVPPKRMAGYTAMGVGVAALLVYWAWNSNFIQVLAPRNVSKAFDQSAWVNGVPTRPMEAPGSQKPAQDVRPELKPAKLSPVSEHVEVAKPVSAPTTLNVPASVEPARAVLLLDGNPVKVKRGLLSAKLNIGTEHVLNASFKGYVPQELRFKATGQPLVIQLRPLPAVAEKVPQPSKRDPEMAVTPPKVRAARIKPTPLERSKKPASDIVTDSPY